MFTFPLSKWVGGIRYEHSHRLIASTVGFLTIILAAWTWRVEPRAGCRRLGFAALGAVILQGLLGGSPCSSSCRRRSRSATPGWRRSSSA
jgi:cytochrome c oxidase assembly protein subunit 15